MGTQTTEIKTMEKEGQYDLLQHNDIFFLLSKCWDMKSSFKFVFLPPHGEDCDKMVSTS
jgi:hypothetical protein